MKTKWPANGLACVMLAGGALLAGSVAAGPQSTVDHQAAIVHAAPARISSVAVEAQGQEPRVQIVGEGELHYRASRLENPTRLVLDFAGATLASRPGSVPGDSALIRNIKVGQFQPDVTRVVVELDHWTPYTVAASSTGVIVEFASSASAADVQTASVRTASLVKSGTMPPPAAKTAKYSQATAAPNMSLPAWLTKTSFALASPAQPLPPAPVPQQQAQTPVSQQSAAMLSQQEGAAQSSMVQGTTHYTGEPIWTNFKDVDLQDFFRLIHEISGLNVVLDPSVRGNLPVLVLDGVPWDQALDIVLKNNNLVKQLDGNVLRIASQATVKAEMDAKADLAKAESNAIEPIVVTRQLSYAKATNLGGSSSSGGKTVQGKGMDDLLKPFLTSRGSIFGDPRTNTLIIRDIPSAIAKMDDLIHQLDRKSQQVEIEARVILTTRSYAQDIGTQLGIQGTAGGGNVTIGGVQSIVPATTTSSGSTTTTGSLLLPLNTNLPAVGATSGISLFSQITPNMALDMIITAMEAKGAGKLLSSPKIMTQNNTEGMVQQGVQIPIQTNINNTVTTQYVNATLMLKVTPQITADGTILMMVHLENTSIDNSISVQGEPGLDTQSVDNQVLARDGETKMLGGVIVDQQNTTTTQVPLLGSVPIIGYLFKERAVSVKSQELLFFLTPRVSQD